MRLWSQRGRLREVVTEEHLHRDQQPMAGLGVDQGNALKITIMKHWSLAFLAELRKTLLPCAWPLLAVRSSHDGFGDSILLP